MKIICYIVKYMYLDVVIYKLTLKNKLFNMDTFDSIVASKILI